MTHDLVELWDYLTPEEKAFAQRAAKRFKPPIWSPLKGPQTMAFNSTADIIGYGGAAGGGKTDLALGKALCQHRRVAVFRKNGTEHTAFIDRTDEVIDGLEYKFNGQQGIWRIAMPAGHTVQIELGSMPNMGDEKKYRGRPHDLKVFDEAAEIPESQVRFLLGWLRTTDTKLHPQALLCFNPPTSAEGRWVIDFFSPWLKRNHPNPALPGELRWYAARKGKDYAVADGRPFVWIDDEPCYDFDAADYDKTEIIKPLSRTFIPARVTDNPYYADGTYMSQLQAMPEPLRSQMLNGDFQAGVSDDPWQVIPTAWVEAAMARWTDLVIKPPMDSIGTDVARGGKDKTIHARRHGQWYDKLERYPGSDTPNGHIVAGQIMSLVRDDAPQHIDVIGVGASPYDILNGLRQQVIGVDVRNKSTGRDKSGRLGFKNLRSQLVWNFRELLDPGNNHGVCLPPDDELKADLTALTWRPLGPLIYVESREEIYDRIKRSADSAWAVFLAQIETPKRSKVGMLNGGGKPYDPYSDIH